MSKRRYHVLKIWPEYFGDLLGYRKRAEVRKIDRPFKVGDRLVLREWNPDTKQYSGRFYFAKITDLLKLDQYGAQGYVMLSVAKPFHIWNWRDNGIHFERWAEQNNAKIVEPGPYV